MSIGVTGREVKAAFVRTNTWGVPASVAAGSQILLTSNDGWDGEPILVDDEAFGQTWIGSGEIGDHNPRTPEIVVQGRFETIDQWLAAACGSVTAPSVVSSIAANSLVAYQHNITLADELTPMFTITNEMEKYVLEIPSMKIRGFNLRIGENGRYMVGFPIVGAKANYDSTVNVLGTAATAVAANLGNRFFRKNTRIRMNVQSAGSLTTTDELSIIKDFAFTYARPLAGDDFVHNQDYIIEPEDDGFADLMVEVTYARMSTIAANSLAIGLKDAQNWKADWFCQGPYINSMTRRSLLIEMPNLQLSSFKGVVTGNNQVRPVAQFKMKLAAAAPTGMSGLVNPFRATLVNANSATLI